MPNNAWPLLDPLFFTVLPYMAFFTFFLVTIQRYRHGSFTYSSLSSQFLENQQHFWGLVPFHYGILTVLAGHIAAWLIPARSCCGTAIRCGSTCWRSRR